MRRALAAAALGCLAAALIAGASRAAAPAPPRLVLVLSIDQLRADRLDPTLPGGLGRIAREGRVFADAAHAHASTETCPGHATILTGHHPGPAGVPLNDYVDPASGKTVYCVEDDAPDARVLGPSGDLGEGRSPRRMRVSTLGDWMKAATPTARVFAVSGKDRSAITMAGRHPDGVYWFEGRPPGGFTTSRYYRAALPEWAQRWHGTDPPHDAFLSGIPEHWEHPSGAPANGARMDDTPWEAARFLRVSGHPLRSRDRKKFLDQVTFSPWLDTLTLDFSRELVVQENLGQGPGPDLLALGLSATDTVGHLYGPGSQEARDALRRLDADLGRFLDALEKRLGPGRVLIALTADHGVLELPEYLAEVGASACPVAGGRIDARALAKELEAAMVAALEPPGSPPHDEPWLTQASLELSVSRKLAAAHGVPIDKVVGAARRFLSTQPGVTRVWTAEEIARGEGPAPWAALYRHSFDPERSGDLTLQTAPGCVLSPYPAGTSHGTPNLYDRAVPLVFLGPGVAPGVVRGRAAPVDVAPTLARQLGVPAPSGLDGRPLELSGE
jgi:predicted AlkP superfamily pyrophosphatase or phosphodiesterase